MTPIQRQRHIEPDPEHQARIQSERRAHRRELAIVVVLGLVLLVGCCVVGLVL